jgi:hypothetical protein
VHRLWYSSPSIQDAFQLKFQSFLYTQQTSKSAPLFTSNSVLNTTTSIVSKHCATTSARSKSASLIRASPTSASLPTNPYRNKYCTIRKGTLLTAPKAVLENGGEYFFCIHRTSDTILSVSLEYKRLKSNKLLVVNSKFISILFI